MRPEYFIVDKPITTRQALVDGIDRLIALPEIRTAARLAANNAIVTNPDPSMTHGDVLVVDYWVAGCISPDDKLVFIQYDYSLSID